MRRCSKCACPLMLVDDERRRLCEQCRRKKMSPVERQRRANQLSYVANRDQRLAQRKERRKAEGEAIRAAERARYAAKRGGTVRPYRRKQQEQTWPTPPIESSSSATPQVTGPHT